MSEKSVGTVTVTYTPASMGKFNATVKATGATAPTGTEVGKTAMGTLLEADGVTVKRAAAPMSGNPLSVTYPMAVEPGTYIGKVEIVWTVSITDTPGQSASTPTP